MVKKVQNYEVLLDSANEAASAYLDMEGGAFLLAWAGELIQDLAAEGNVRSAALAAKKLCEAVDVEMQCEQAYLIGIGLTSLNSKSTNLSYLE